MPKSTQLPPSHKADAKEQDHSRSHPLRRHQSQAEAMLEAQKKRQEVEEQNLEDLEEWKKALTRLATSPDGKLFLRTMLRACGLFAPGERGQTVRAVEDKQRQDFYLRLVRPYLTPMIRGEFE